jgi:putative colanic acid biosynthesis UDP-glucose lipid carrier transferase
LRKRALDLTVCTLAAVAFAIPMLIIAALVKSTSRGPVLFTQPRVGADGVLFPVKKFRTMRDGTHAEVLSDDNLHALYRANDFKLPSDDPRITTVGRFLRKTSLDELPQLFNVLRGEMSLIGPRPHAVEHNKKYAVLIGDYHWRHKVKPGITGWAQVNGFRGETDTLEKMRLRFEHDVYYIENWSLWFDFKILVMTAFIGWSSKNAY